MRALNPRVDFNYGLNSNPTSIFITFDSLREDRSLAEYYDELEIISSGWSAFMLITSIIINGEIKGNEEDIYWLTSRIITKMRHTVTIIIDNFSNATLDPKEIPPANFTYVVEPFILQNYIKLWDNVSGVIEEDNIIINTSSVDLLFSSIEILKKNDINCKLFFFKEKLLYTNVLLKKIYNVTPIYGINIFSAQLGE